MEMGSRHRGGTRLTALATALLAALLVGSDGTGEVSAGTERNNWAVLVESSRYWYNYRHAANTLSFYHTVKRLGIPDSQILLMMAEDMPCNARNTRPGTVFNEMHHHLNLYGEEVEVDYRGDEVSVESFLRLLTGRHPPSTPRNKRLLTDSSSNIFIFITGHSGEEFIKFQDWEELTSNDIADAFQQMKQQRRYKQIFWVSDTCQAATLQNQFYSPGILAYGSSGKKENSYSHHVDPELGVAVIDRFTFFALDHLNKLTPTSSETVKSFTGWFNPAQLKATPEMRTDLFGRDTGDTLLTEFLASTGRPRFQLNGLPLARDPQLAGDDALAAAWYGGKRAKNRTASALSDDERGSATASEVDLGQLYNRAKSLWHWLQAKALPAVDVTFSAQREEGNAGSGMGAVPWLLGFAGLGGVATVLL